MSVRVAKSLSGMIAGGWRRGALFAAALAAVVPGVASLAQTPRLGDAERSAVVLRAATLVRERFYDPVRGERAADLMRRSLEAGDYAQLQDPAAFALAITAQIRPVLNDQHFRVEFVAPDPAPPQVPEPAAAEPRLSPDAALREAYRLRNFDFHQATLLDGNVGYLKVFTFAPLSMGQDTAVAAMRFLAGADALIIDLRGNRGGYPDMGLFLASYLFDRPTHYATRYRRVGDRREEEWTRAELPGPRLSRQDVFILVSRDTFSGGESLAYSLQALGRATVIGEPTQGGATGADLLQVNERFYVNVSDVNFTSPATGGNWEGVGVRPDIPASRRAALTIAHLAALQTMSLRSPARIEYRWAQDLVRARSAPLRVDPRHLRRLAGTYGERVLTWEGDALAYRRGEGPIYTLVPLGGDEFMLDGSITARFRIARHGSDLELQARFSDGSEERAARAP